ncbi:MAG: DUF4178 domain-containing protein [Acidobacteria bacterium]|nr:DUF4178 domain-containing protein [Acidobacteriota bacterium]
MVAAPRVPTPAAIRCPGCGGNIELRGFSHTRSAVCVQCSTIIDPSTPELTILQRFDDRMRVQPIIPLGTRGKWQGTLYEVIGFQVRTINSDGVDYSWHEYLLFNPYRGFRYLTQYDGHWSDVIPVHGLPAFTTMSGRKAASYNGTVYAHFQNARAETTFVMGEFPWAVRVGETNVVDDYTAPPYLLSSEVTEDEVNWSFSTYVPADTIWHAFGLKGAPPPARGIYVNQPSPYAGKAGKAWSTFIKLLLVWGVLLAWFVFSASNREVFRHAYHFAQTSPGEHSFVTDVFQIDGRGNLEVELRTDLNNNWAYFNLALLREDGSQGFDFGREVSYYSGRDSDGAWSEGKARDSVTLPRVAAGRYYLRIEPEMDPQASAQAASGMSMNYEVVLRRDVPSSWLFWLALPFLILPPVVTSIRAAAFETQRWAESDYGTNSGSGSSGGDDDE